MNANRNRVGKPTLIRVVSGDPPVFLCATCGWTPERPADPAADPLFWPVIEHWLMTHWELGPGGDAR